MTHSHFLLLKKKSGGKKLRNFPPPALQMALDLLIPTHSQLLDWRQVAALTPEVAAPKKCGVAEIKPTRTSHLYVDPIHMYTHTPRVGYRCYRHSYSCVCNMGTGGNPSCDLCVGARSSFHLFGGRRAENVICSSSSFVCVQGEEEPEGTAPIRPVRYLFSCLWSRRRRRRGHRYQRRVLPPLWPARARQADCGNEESGGGGGR